MLLLQTVRLTAFGLRFTDCAVSKSERARTFIGMRCYLDDMCYDLMKIGSNVDYIVRCVFCVPRAKSAAYADCDENNAYIGMRTSVISSKKGVTVGENAVVGACTLVNKDVPAGQTAVVVPCRILSGEK